MPSIDHRLIQTAVIGGRNSDSPVILPEEPHNLDEFRGRYGTDDFWCGTLLGGCGEQLMTKRYETKVCHFSHYPDRDGNGAPCHRAANGMDSADHLFIKRHVSNWLSDQGHAAQSELRSLGRGPGDAVDFWLRATGQHLRFALCPEDYQSWRKAAESLAVRDGHVEWIFGPAGPITQDLVARQGYALRVRCDTDGTDRRVLIGTVIDKGPIAWEPLELCQMTRDGIVTPTLDKLRADGHMRVGGMRIDAPPASLPLRGAEIVFAMDPYRERSVTSPLAEEGRYLIPGFVKPTGSRIVRATLSLPDAVPVPTDAYVYQLSGVVRLLVTDAIGVVDTSWAIHADSILPLNGLDAERTGLWRPSVALDQPVRGRRGVASAQHDSVSVEHFAAGPKVVVKPTTQRHVAVQTVKVPNSPERQQTASHPPANKKVEKKAETTWAEGRKPARIHSSEVQSSVAELKEMRPRLGPVAQKRVDALLRDVEAWLKLQQGGRLPKQQKDKLAQWDVRRVQGLLDKVFRHVRNDLKMAAYLERYEKERREAPLSSPPSPARAAESRRGVKASPAEPSVLKGSPERQLEALSGQLMRAATQQKTLTMFELPGGRMTPDREVTRLLIQIDLKTGDMAPMLSALVTDEDGNPPPLFRLVLRGVGLAVPQTDEALRKVWLREQERAHAAYASVRRPLPPRLVPMASAAGGNSKVSEGSAE